MAMVCTSTPNVSQITIAANLSRLVAKTHISCPPVVPSQVYLNNVRCKRHSTRQLLRWDSDPRARQPIAVDFICCVSTLICSSQYASGTATFPALLSITAGGAEELKFDLSSRNQIPTIVIGLIYWSLKTPLQAFHSQSRPMSDQR
jgi:hypothetical protein